MRLTRCAMAMLIWATLAVAAHAEEAVTIGLLLHDPEPFHLKQVTVVATVTYIEAVEPYYLPSGSGCYGAFRLTVKDDTGELPVAILGVCGAPILRPTPAVPGDRVRLHLQIQAPGHHGSFYGLDKKPLPGTNPQALTAIVQDLRIVAP